MIETTTLNIYRPFGAGSVTVNVPCRFSNQFTQHHPKCPLTFTSAVEVADDVDIRDGCSRGAGDNSITYGDGDEVRIAGLSAGTRFVVVWVDRIIMPPGQPAKKIAYLLRDTAAWPGP